MNELKKKLLLVLAALLVSNLAQAIEINQTQIKEIQSDSSSLLLPQPLKQQHKKVAGVYWLPDYVENNNGFGYGDLVNEEDTPGITTQKCSDFGKVSCTPPKVGVGSGSKPIPGSNLTCFSSCTCSAKSNCDNTFTLTQPPANASSSSCQTIDASTCATSASKYKINSCNDGYILASSVCNIRPCPANFTAGLTQAQCPNITDIYSTDGKSGSQICGKCTSGCSDNYKYDTCPTGAICGEPCGGKYAVTSCKDGYDVSTISSTPCTPSKCVSPYIAGVETCSNPSDTYSSKGKSGEKVCGYCSCVTKDCSSHTLKKIPANAQYSVCETGCGYPYTKYKIESCNPGYIQVGNTCQENSCKGWILANIKDSYTVETIEDLEKIYKEGTNTDSETKYIVILNDISAPTKKIEVRNMLYLASAGYYNQQSGGKCQGRYTINAKIFGSNTYGQMQFNDLDIKVETYGDRIYNSYKSTYLYNTTITATDTFYTTLNFTSEMVGDEASLITAKHFVTNPNSSANLLIDVKIVTDTYRNFSAKTTFKKSLRVNSHLQAQPNGISSKIEFSGGKHYINKIIHYANNTPSTNPDYEIKVADIVLDNAKLTLNTETAENISSLYLAGDCEYKVSLKNNSQIDFRGSNVERVYEERFSFNIDGNSSVVNLGSTPYNSGVDFVAGGNGYLTSINKSPICSSVIQFEPDNTSEVASAEFSGGNFSQCDINSVCEHEAMCSNIKLDHVACGMQDITVDKCYYSAKNDEWVVDGTCHCSCGNRSFTDVGSGSNPGSCSGARAEAVVQCLTWVCI